MRRNQIRFTAESFTYQWSTTPAYFYVWDAKFGVMIGGNHTTRESAQADADQRNQKASAAAS